ncbi:MAG: hypothetical protein H6751_16050 [Candidatus Omnitrophica bacterium]|nr:hypothetical protein [Candidatus Omnitrophota bacterium]
MKIPSKISIAVMAVFFGLLGFLPHFRDTLAFNPGSITSLWGWGTCHWVHWNLSHLFWSGGTFLVLLAIWPKEEWFRFILCCMVAMAGIPLGLWFLSGSPEAYAGLSGVDSGLFVTLVLLWIRERLSESDRLSAGAGWILLLGFVFKIGFEAITGLTLFATPNLDYSAVPVAHLMGGLAGLIAVLPWRPLFLRDRLVEV